MEMILWRLSNSLVSFSVSMIVPHPFVMVNAVVGPISMSENSDFIPKGSPIRETTYSPDPEVVGLPRDKRKKLGFVVSLMS